MSNSLNGIAATISNASLALNDSSDVVATMLSDRHHTVGTQLHSKHLVITTYLHNIDHAMMACHDKFRCPIDSGDEILIALLKHTYTDILSLDKQV